jgi:hypothetical protein
LVEPAVALEPTDQLHGSSLEREDDGGRADLLELFGEKPRTVTLLGAGQEIGSRSWALHDIGEADTCSDCSVVLETVAEVIEQPGSLQPSKEALPLAALVVVTSRDATGARD